MSNNLFNWDKNFSVGNDEMDNQHKKLIEIINELFIHFNNGNAQEIILQILDKMVNYSILHLTSEEKYLKEIDYPYIEEHKLMHNSYKQQIILFRNKIRSDNDEVHYELFNYLKDWWTNHILEEDMKYFDFMSI